MPPSNIETSGKAMDFRTKTEAPMIQSTPMGMILQATLQKPASLALGTGRVLQATRARIWWAARAGAPVAAAEDLPWTREKCWQLDWFRLKYGDFKHRNDPTKWKTCAGIELGILSHLQLVHYYGYCPLHDAPSSKST